ncbi:sigma-70 RNA polymerase sigma factor region 4 domain-containing protein [Streptomyces carminius]|nr:sigma-70 family RNA polymerase sigma factor [Streptomyces carminius]
MLATAYESYQDRLLAYVADRVPAYHWSEVEDLAQDTWEYALAHANLAVTGTEESGLPTWLAATARTVIRRHLTPSVPEYGTDWAALAQALGPAHTWPARWHQVLASQGQAALLRLAATELADDGRASAIPAVLVA